ncbi:MAG: flagellar basal body-associated FliL family protein [Gemmatimonadaceae bacterium]|nr:flagellar basal body-associated FliL family protein [Gemmatimonadaceae bacterium]
MAKEEAKPAEQPAEGAAPAKPKLPILIGMVAVGLAVGGGTGAALLGPMVAKKMGKVPPAAEASKGGEGEKAAAGEHAAPAEGEKPAEGGKEGAGAEAPVLMLDNLVLNPANSGGSRFLLLTVALEVSSATTMEDFKKRDAELRDIILTALGTKTVEQLTDITMREKFKSEISAAVESRFGKKTVKRLYFPQFVVQ